MFWTVPLSIISSFSLYTQQWYLSYRFADSLRAVRKTCITYTIAVCMVKTPDDGQRSCLKHVEFYSKNKFEKLVHLVGFIIKMYYYARSPECQICHCLALACKRYRTLGHMCLKPKDLENMRVNGLISLVVNTGFGIIT